MKHVSTELVATVLTITINEDRNRAHFGSGLPAWT